MVIGLRLGGIVVHAVVGVGARARGWQLLQQTGQSNPEAQLYRQRSHTE